VLGCTGRPGLAGLLAQVDLRHFSTLILS